MDDLIPTFEAMHSETADLHYEGPSHDHGKIVIDAAYIPVPFGRGYEIMTLKPNGKEIECVTVQTLDEARIAWADMFNKYVGGRHNGK